MAGWVVVGLEPDEVAFALVAPVSEEPLVAVVAVVALSPPAVVAVPFVELEPPPPQPAGAMIASATIAASAPGRCDRWEVSLERVVFTRVPSIRELSVLSKLIESTGLSRAHNRVATRSSPAAATPRGRQ